jgi:HK97 gp10 family phage protein
MRKLEVTLTGLEEARRQLRRIVPIVERESSQGRRNSAARTRDSARAFAPVRTGALRDAITLVDDGPSSTTVGVTGAPSLYAHFPEYGTVHIPAQPFMRPAADQERQPFVSEQARAGRVLERELSR